MVAVFLMTVFIWTWRINRMTWRMRSPTDPARNSHVPAVVVLSLKNRMLPMMNEG